MEMNWCVPKEAYFWVAQLWKWLCIWSAEAYSWEHTRQDPSSAKVSKSTDGHLQVVYGLWKVEESNSHHLKGKGGLQLKR